MNSQQHDTDKTQQPLRPTHVVTSFLMRSDTGEPRILIVQRSQRVGSYHGQWAGISGFVEPGITPDHPVVLSWPTFTEAADQAGMSRRYGGIHFRRADLVGRQLGRLVAAKVWSKAQSYFARTLNGPAPSFAGNSN